MTTTDGVTGCSVFSLDWTGPRRVGSSPSARCSISSSSWSSSTRPRGPSAARQGPGMGQWGEEVCGNHSSQAHSGLLSVEVRQAITTSAGECSEATWMISPRAISMRLGSHPTTPRPPTERRSATMGVLCSNRYRSRSSVC